MPAISEDQVIALAPDDNSVKSAQELASSDRWFRYGAGENTVWGECPGSGGRPYQTCIDIAAPAFKCSCPGRKFPCKHGLGLLLFFCRFPETFVCRDIPDWAGHWLQSRRASQEKKTEKSQELSARIPDFQARDRRKSERLAKVESGLSEFRLWVQDRIRQGLSGLESQSYQFWERAAARLTDAQAPGLARQLRQCAGIANSGQGWQARLLCRLCLL